MALEFETMTPAGTWGDDCETAVLDLRPYIPDEALRGIPRFFGRWEDSTSTKLILDDNYAIAAGATDCDYDIASRELQECTVLLPDQQLVPIGLPTSDMVYTQVMQRFCKAKNLVRYPTLFRADGSFDPGQPLSGVFLEYLLSELSGAVAKALRNYAWDGDEGASTKQFWGILTQLDNGPLSPGDGCGPYSHVSLNWQTLTNAAAPAAPTATIDAGSDSITIHGEDFAGMTGLNMVEFMRLWLERLMENELAGWSQETIMFELWVPRGQTTCIAESAACMQPCGNEYTNPMDDPSIRDRAASFRRDKVIYLYPYDDIPIVIKTSPELDNRYILLPKMIGGRPTVAWIFRDQVEQLAILEGELPMYGSQTGLPDPTPLYPEDQVITGDEFFNRAFSLNLQRNTNCLEVWLNCESAIVLQGIHMWLEFTNVDCAGLVPQVNESMGVAATACDDTAGTGNQISFTVAGLGTVDAGDAYVVYFEDGYTALIATAVSYADPALLLDFGMAVDDTTGGGCTTATIVKLADN